MLTTGTFATLTPGDVAIGDTAPTESVTVTETVYVPTAVGVHVIVAEFAGLQPKAPDDWVHV